MNLPWPPPYKNLSSFLKVVYGATVEHPEDTLETFPYNKPLFLSRS